ncbi:MAG: hypothetical protein ACLPND_04160 [Candidatus Korobacteraceae bacterium]
MSGVPKWQRKGGAVTPKKSASDKKKIESHQKNVAAEQEIMQPVVRTVRENSFVHCYLACGHMITVHREGLKESSPSSMECWACEEEQRETRRSLQ